MLLRKLLLFVFLAAGCATSAQYTPRHLLRPYTNGLPALLLPREQWQPFPRTPEAWRHLLPDTLLREIVRTGEAALKTEYHSISASRTLEFLRTGNRFNYEQASFEKRARLWELILAESVEGKGRFAEQIMNGVWSVCEESFWGITAHLGQQKAGKGLPDVEEPTVDLFAAETACVLAWTDYFAGPALDKLSPLIRPRIYYETSRRVLTPMLTAKYGYLGNGNDQARLNNWAPWVMSNYITAALLLEKDSALRTRECALGMKYTDQYINGLGNDGGCEEGPSYWTAAAGCVFDALNVLYDASAGKINVYRQPFLKTMATYIYDTHIAGNYFINVADAHPSLEPDPFMLFRFGRAVADTTLAAFGSWLLKARPSYLSLYEQFHHMRGLFDLEARTACAQYPAQEPQTPTAWYPSLQLMTARAGRLFLAAHGGNNGESHNHNDVGDFIVYADGQPVIIDVGAGSYTARTFSSQRYQLWFNSSGYHNLPLINGIEQQEGAGYAASGVQYLANKKSVRLNMDIAGAWPAAAGVQHWQRTVELDKKEGIRISDQYRLNAVPRELSQTFMTVAETDFSRPGRIVFTYAPGKQLTLYYDAAVFEAQKTLMELTLPEDQGLKQSWSNRAIYRIRLLARTPAAQGGFVYSIR